MAAKRVTAADVARAARVSATTVSFVLNETAGQSIPESTRQRVLRAADRLGYAPSAAARALARGRTGVVLCLLRDMPVGSALAALLSQVAHTLEAHDLTMVWHPRSPQSRPLSDVWRDVTPAAVLTFDELDESEQRALRATGAVVVVSRVDPSDPRQGQSDYHHGRVQAEYLVQRGHRLLGYASPQDERVTDVGRVRLLGVRDVVREHGLPDPVEATVDYDDPESAGGALETWTGAGVEAVCAYNDETALTVLASAARAGVPAPRIIGIDDTPAAALSVPALTTVRRDWATTGDYLAARIVADLRGDPPPEVPVSYRAQVVERESA